MSRVPIECSAATGLNWYLVSLHHIVDIGITASQYSLVMKMPSSETIHLHGLSILRLVQLYTHTHYSAGQTNRIQCGRLKELILLVRQLRPRIPFQFDAFFFFRFVFFLKYIHLILARRLLFVLFFVFRFVLSV